MRNISLPQEAMNSITVANLKDWYDYLVEETAKYHSNPQSKDNPSGYWMHPEDVILNSRYIDALKLLIPAFGGSVE